MTKRDRIAEALTAHWGERCAENEPGCPCCDAWAQYDALKSLVEAAEKVRDSYWYSSDGIITGMHDLETALARVKGVM